MGVIYDGSPEDKTDRAWVADAIAHYEAYDETAGSPPEQIVFQSWNANPTRVLPETSPGTLTYLVASYFRPIPSLEARRVGSTVEGRLRDPAGRPIAEVPVSLEGLEPSGPGFPIEESVRGTVPAAAVSAVVGPEINIGCACTGASEVRIAALHYRETSGGTAAVERGFARGLAGWDAHGTAAAAVMRDGPAGERHLRIVTRPSESLYLHSAPFRVTADAAFTFGGLVRMSASPEDIGFLVVIFLDGHGREIGRARILLRPGYGVIGEARTDAEGRFAIPLPAGAASDAVFRAVFRGDGRYRRWVQAVR